MSARLIGMAFLTDAGPTDKLVLVALADQQRDETGVAYPSLGTLTLMTSLSERAVRYSLRSLAEAGHITQLSTGGGRFKSARYQVHPRTGNPALDAAFQAENPAASALFEGETRQQMPVMEEKPGTECPVSEGNPAPHAGNPARGAENPAPRAPDTLSNPYEPLVSLLPAGGGAGAGAHTRVSRAMGWNPDTGWTGITQELQEQLKQAFPRINLGIELMAADAWLQQNPKKRKSNYFSFLTNWLGRASPSSGGTGESDDMSGSQKKEGGAGPVFSAGGARPAPPGWRGAFEAVIGRPPEDGWSSLPAAVQADVLRTVREATELERAAWAEKERGAA